MDRYYWNYFMGRKNSMYIINMKKYKYWCWYFDYIKLMLVEWWRNLGMLIYNIVFDGEVIYVKIVFMKIFLLLKIRVLVFNLLWIFIYCN